MAIDCLYSLDGGQLSLTRGKFLLYKHSQFQILSHLWESLPIQHSEEVKPSTKDKAKLE